VKIAGEMAAFDALRRMFHLTPSRVLFKYGQAAYDIDYSQMERKNASLSEFKLSQFNDLQNEAIVRNAITV
jgi:hypothetical protein